MVDDMAGLLQALDQVLGNVAIVLYHQNAHDPRKSGDV
jgi:hypothetical protein